MELSALHRVLIYSLLFLSGAAGLIYQVVWHRYLGILLGAQAKATAIILAIFLGGISAGYAVFGYWSRRKKWNLLLAYTLVELGLATWAFLFPVFFKFGFPRMGSLYQGMGVENPLVDFAIAILLLGLPTFLMGGTLPLLTQGLSRDLREASRTHALIYGFNTLGACLGCMLAGYLLIPSFGFGATSMAGGTLNLIVAVLSYVYFARHAKVQVPDTEPKTESTKPRAAHGPSLRVVGLWAIGFLSGFYLITLETVLIRLMGLSSGSSNYNFTLIVAIFIFGLGIGSVVARGIEKYRFRDLMRNQVWVAILLTMVYLSGNYWSYGSHVLRSLLRDLPQNFYVYQFLMAMAFFALLTIPLAFSGLTLPLCFHLIKDGKGNLGERVGQLYSLNTVGCVLGALVGGYVFLNYVDLDQLYKICLICILFTAAIAGYLYMKEESKNWRPIMASCFGLVVTLFGVVAAPSWNRDSFIQPFRHPSPIDDVTFAGPAAFSEFLSRSTKLLYWKDGPNTSVGIGTSKYDGKEISRTIFVNGKSDGNTRGDHFTTVMLAHIPALLTPKIDNSLIIGLGTGMTVGALAAYPESKNIDVVEISNFSIKKIDYFDSYNKKLSTNLKAKFHEMDAFRYMQGTTKLFDIIISEPSNPWVAGIENLYSDEFYHIALDKLTPGGTFVQWIHTYSFNDDLFRLVLSTVSKRFPYVSIFQLKGGDLAIVCRKKEFDDESLKTAAERYATHAWLRKELADSGLERIDAMLGLEVAPHPMARIMGHGRPIHTLTSPILSNEAARAFFAGNTARIQLLRRNFKEYLAILDHSLLSRWLDGQPLSLPALQGMKNGFCDQYISKTNFLCEEVLAMSKLRDNSFISGALYDDVVSARDIASLSVFHDKFDKKFDEAELQKVFNMFDLYKKVASPIAHVPVKTFAVPLERCLAQQKTIGGALYGECLLQKLLVLENLATESDEKQTAIVTFQAWFKTLPKSTAHYSKFEEASHILKQMSN